MESSLLV